MEETYNPDLNLDEISEDMDIVLESNLDHSTCTIPLSYCKMSSLITDCLNGAGMPSKEEIREINLSKKECLERLEIFNKIPESELSAKQKTEHQACLDVLEGLQKIVIGVSIPGNHLMLIRDFIVRHKGESPGLVIMPLRSPDTKEWTLVGGVDDKESGKTESEWINIWKREERIQDLVDHNAELVKVHGTLEEAKAKVKTVSMFREMTRENTEEQTEDVVEAKVDTKADDSPITEDSPLYADVNSVLKDFQGVKIDPEDVKMIDDNFDLLEYHFLTAKETAINEERKKPVESWKFMIGKNITKIDVTKSYYHDEYRPQEIKLEEEWRAKNDKRYKKQDEDEKKYLAAFQAEYVAKSANLHARNRATAERLNDFAKSVLFMGVISLQYMCAAKRAQYFKGKTLEENLSIRLGHYPSDEELEFWKQPLETLKAIIEMLAIKKFGTPGLVPKDIAGPGEPPNIIQVPGIRAGVFNAADSAQFYFEYEQEQLDKRRSAAARDGETKSHHNTRPGKEKRREGVLSLD